MFACLMTPGLCPGELRLAKGPCFRFSLRSRQNVSQRSAPDRDRARLSARHARCRQARRQRFL